MEQWSSGAVENKAADKAIGAWVTSQPIVFCTRERSRNGQHPLTHKMQVRGVYSQARKMVC